MVNDSLLTDKEVRAKLLAKGVAALSDIELLSLLLPKVDKYGSSVEVADRLLSRFSGNLAALGSSDLQTLRMTENMGLQNAVTVAVAFELGRRFRSEELPVPDTITTDRDIIQYFQPLLADLSHEEFWLVLLNTSNRVIDRVRISQGGVSGTVVDHRLIVKRAVEKLAHGMILIHNHPSGNEQPSEEDRLLTERLTLAASLFEMILLDHVIITTSSCYSFRNAGFFDK